MINIGYVSDAIRLIKQELVGDGVDVLVGVVSALFCLICTTVVVGKQALGPPMTCFNLGYLKSGQDKYATEYCYIQSSYFVNWSTNHIAWNKDNYYRVNYYPFVGVLFFAMVFILHLPSHFWRKIYERNPIAIGRIVEECESMKEEGKEKRTEKLNKLDESIVTTIQECRTDPKFHSVFLNMGGSSPMKLSVAYCLLKLVNMSIVASFLWVVTLFLDETNYTWTFDRVFELLIDHKWTESRNFPRETFCDFRNRDLGNTRNNTIQCLLSMNFVNEKVFFAQGVWFSIVLGLCAFNFVQFAVAMLPGSRFNQIKRWLNRPLKLELRNKHIDYFKTCIGPDGFLVLYFVDCTSGSRVASELAVNIYKNLERDVEENVQFSSIDEHLIRKSFDNSMHSDSTLVTKKSHNE